MVVVVVGGALVVASATLVVVVATGAAVDVVAASVVGTVVGGGPSTVLVGVSELHPRVPQGSASAPHSAATVRMPSSKFSSAKCSFGA